MRIEDMNFTIKVKDILNILSNDIAYRDLTEPIIHYLAGADLRAEEVVPILTSFNKKKTVLAEEKRKRLASWVNNKGNLGMTEGLVFSKGVTNSEEIEGKAGKYILIWYTELIEDIVIIAKHLNSKEEVRNQILADIDDFGFSIVRDLYVIDVENKSTLSFTITIGKDTGCMEVKFLV